MSSEQNAMAGPGTDAENTTMLVGMATVLGGKQPQEFTVHEQRAVFQQLQANPKEYNGVAISDEVVSTSNGDVKAFLYKPEGKEDIPFVYFIHGGGFIFGGASEWKEFICELVTRSQVAVVFPEYTLAPDRQFPAQHEQCVEVLQHIVKTGQNLGLKVDKFVVASDSVAGQLATAMSILNVDRSLGFNIAHQIMLHPTLDTAQELGEGPLSNREWFDQQVSAYFASPEDRNSLLGAPGRMSAEQAKKYMPPTTIVTAEVDGLRPHGEAFARFLQQSGVSCGLVCAMACMHDFEIFNLSRRSPTSALIMGMISSVITNVLLQ